MLADENTNKKVVDPPESYLNMKEVFDILKVLQANNPGDLTPSEVYKMEQAFQDIDYEFSEALYKSLKIKPNELMNNSFSHEANIELFARALIFWENMKNEIQKKIRYTIKDELRILLQKSIHNKIKDFVMNSGKFTKSDRLLIHKRIHMLTEPSRIKNMNIIKKKLDIIYKIAEMMYKKCVDAGFTSIPNPNKWVLMDELLRIKWIQISECYKENPALKDIREPEYNYMSFMCKNYPTGIGKKIDNGLRVGFFDSAEIYLDCIEEFSLNYSKNIISSTLKQL